MKEEFNLDISNFKYFAGHSLGEYSALVCSESLSYEDALKLLKARGKFMQEAVPSGKGKMLAVLGANIEEINLSISKLNDKGVCEIANDNATGQIIVSGESNSINELINVLKRANKKSIPLNVSAPFHCSLMKKAEVNMISKINETNFKTPKVKIISNVKAEPENQPEKIKKLLIDQICSKVRWRESVIYMSENNIDEFIEIGPGKVLSNLIKRTLKDKKILNVNTVDDIKKII